MATREARLALAMLVPAFFIVFAIILFPVLLNFWISFKDVKLGDLRTPQPVIREQIARRPKSDGDILLIRYRVRNSSKIDSISSISIRAQLPHGLSALELPEDFRIRGNTVLADFEKWEAGYSDIFELKFKANADFISKGWAQATEITYPHAEGMSQNRLFNLTFSLQNYRNALSDSNFLPSLINTFAYTSFGSLGAIFLGLMAAQLVNTPFRGKTLLRGLLLFPYVAPVIAVAFAWVFFLDPFSGTVNALLIQFGIVENGISFLSKRSFEISFFGLNLRLPLALSTVIAFDSWRYFPFAFLFILARLQAIPSLLYESADVDGAGPYLKFWFITLPQVRGVLGTLFLLRFMWTFNKFDDVFLLTGGAAGTRTLPIQVYDNAFGRSDIGAGAASSVLLFAFLALFLIIYSRCTPEEQSQ